eukprot:126528_1
MIRNDDEYNDGTMLITNDDNDDNDDDNYNDYGTMLINNDDQKNHNDNAIYSDQDIDNGTMLINDGTMVINNDIDENYKNVKVFTSMLQGHKVINQLLPIPNNVTKNELFSLWKKVQSITEIDMKNLENFYKEQIECINQKIK